MQTVLTQAHYSQRAKKLIALAAYDTPNAAGNPVGVARWLINTKQNYSKATFRQYRAALIYEFNQCIQADAEQNSSLVEAISLLRACSP
ncbi:MAG: hypothetical protein ACXWJF_10635, partial [Burkholderiaceae bacterium]